MAKLLWKKTGLYPILDLDFCERNSLSISNLIRMWEEYPEIIDCIQIRSKTRSPKEIEHKYKEISRLTSLNIVINDYWEVALEVGSYGLHLGKEDYASLNEKQKEKIANAKIIKGTSCHSVSDLQNLDTSLWNYTGFGPIFQSGTKKTSYPILGTSILRDVLSRFSIPITPIGGINSINFWSVVYMGDCKPASISLFSDELLFPLIAKEYMQKLHLTRNL